MKNKLLVILSIAILALLFIGGKMFYTKQEQQNLDALASSNSSVFVREHSPQFGENKNNVVLVEFLDPMCEACAAFYPNVKKLFHEYENEITLVVRYLANHNNSQYVVKLLEASRLQGKFKEVLEIVFNTQGIWALHGQEKPQMIWDFIKDVPALDMKKLRADFDVINIDALLATDYEDALTLKVRGTPTFFVNGKKLTDFSGQGLYDLVESEIYK